MIFDVNDIPHDAWPAILDEMQHRIMALDLDLRQCMDATAVDSPAIRQRQVFLSELKKQLSLIKGQTRGHTKGISHDWQSLLPGSLCCSKKEKALIRGFHHDRIAVLSEMTAANAQIVSQASKIASNGLGIFGVFAFSKLRKILVNSENLQRYIVRRSQETREKSEALVRSGQEIMTNTLSADVRGLMAIFDRIDEMRVEIQKRRSNISKKRAQLEWKQSWLSVQHHRLANYSPKLDD